LEHEKITSSNGKRVKVRGHNGIEWDKNIKVIKLSLKRLKFEENEINLAKYYKTK